MSENNTAKKEETQGIKQTNQVKIPELQHRNFRDDEFWKKIPAWASVTREEFKNHLWQMKNSIRKVEQVEKVLGKLCTPEFMKDLLEGQKRTPMNIRITPYIFFTDQLGRSLQRSVD